MKCPNCETISYTPFCPKCGTQIAFKCKKCGAVLNATQEHCGWCGEKNPFYKEKEERGA